RALRDEIPERPPDRPREADRYTVLRDGGKGALDPRDRVHVARPKGVFEIGARRVQQEGGGGIGEIDELGFGETGRERKGHGGLRRESIVDERERRPREPIVSVARFAAPEDFAIRA